jgi:hypothetical protein
MKLIPRQKPRLEETHNTNNSTNTYYMYAQHPRENTDEPKLKTGNTGTGTGKINVGTAYDTKASFSMNI